MGAVAGLGVAAAFVWVGMVLGISFLEAPLKFGAPDVTLRIGLGIGRRVFRALNAAEVVLAVLLLVSVVAGGLPTPATVSLVLAMALLAAQLILVRPRLTRRSNAVLAGEDAPRSHAHHAYIALETIKLIALVTGTTLTLAS